MKKVFPYILLLFVVFTACKKPFLPDVVSTTKSYLVVEGVINSSTDSTIIRLSKTVSVGGVTRANKLNNCTVTVEGEQGSKFILPGDGNGRYLSPSVPIDASKKYRLHIITNDGKEYASDYIAVKQTPAIDDVTVDTVNYNSNNGKYAQLYVNTHDATNNTRYYRWEFVETWKIQAMFESFFIVDGKKIRERTPNEQAFICYQTDTSTNIYIGSSAKLAQDVINLNPLGVIPKKTLKLKYRYSVLIKQYALTKDEYQFWENMQKNTEQLGSIFDAQPSQISGNVHNLKDTTEPVIGYVSITNIQTKRIFIGGNQISSNDVADYPFSGCKLDSADYSPLPLYGPPGCLYACIVSTGGVLDSIVNSGGLRVPTLPTEIPGDGKHVRGWRFSELGCVDCRVRGTNIRPSFWID